MRRSAPVAIVLGVLLASSAARAFCRETTISPDPAFIPSASTPCWTEGLPVFWKNACVGYWVQENASKQVSVSEAKQVMDAAFAPWMSAACAGGPPSIKVENQGDVACHKVEYNEAGANANILLFDDSAWKHDAGSGGGDTLALTTTTYNTATGELYDVDIEVDTHDNVFPLDGTDTDLQAVLTHEAGHFLGLAHSIDTNATMFAMYRGIAMRTLTSDDVDGICAIYAPDGKRSVADGGVVDEGSCDTTPRHGFASACDAPSPGCSCSTVGETTRTFAPLVALSGALAVTALRRRRRRKFRQHVASG